jgi:hypothetical protein
MHRRKRKTPLKRRIESRHTQPQRALLGAQGGNRAGNRAGIGAGNRARQEGRPQPRIDGRAPA